MTGEPECSRSNDADETDRATMPFFYEGADFRRNILTAK